MDEESSTIEDELKHNFETRVKEKLPAIQRAIQAETGKAISTPTLMEILSTPLAELAIEVTTQATYAYSGPMPSPHIMAGYVELFPGAADQLFRQFESEQKHRHNWENNALKMAFGERSRRDFGSYLLTFCGLSLAAFLAYLGSPAIAALLGGFLVLGGGAIIFGRQFFASHSKDGTHVAINHDQNSPHKDNGSQKASKKAKSGYSKR